MTERINGKLLRRALVAARERGETDVGISEETFQFWKANAGNAKARRRWRRRNVPNMQRIAALAKAVYGGTLRTSRGRRMAWRRRPLPSLCRSI